MQVAAFKGDLFIQYAEKFSRDNDYELHVFSNYNAFECEDIDDDMVIFMEPQHITEQLVMRANRPGCYSRKSYGIITGLNENDVKRKVELYKKDSVCLNNKTAVVMRTVNREINHDTEFEVLTRYGIGVENIRNLKEYSIISAMLNGNRRHLHVNDGFICGINRDIGITELKEEYPECVCDNNNRCNENIVYADTFTASCFFLNSCSSSLIGTSNAGNMVNVPMNLNKSCDALISGFRPKEGNENENLLFALLMNRGYSMGEMLNVLNLNSHYNNSDYYPFILFGFPDQKATKKTEIFPEGNLACKIHNNKSNLSIEVNTEGTNLVEVNLQYPNAQIKEKIMNREYSIRFHGNLNDEVFFTLIPFKDGIKLLLYSWKSFTIEGDIIMEFNGADPFSDILKRRLNNLRKLRIMGFNHKKFLNQVHNYEQLLGNYIRVADKSKYVLNHKELYKIKSKLSNEEKLLTDLITGEIERQGNNFFFEKYEKTTFIRSAADKLHQTAKCPYCNNHLFMKHSTNELYDLRRISAFCSECHNVFDAEWCTDEKKLYPYPIIEYHSSENGQIIFEISREPVSPTSNTSLYVSIWAESRSEANQLIVEMDGNPYFATEKQIDKKLICSIKKKDANIHPKHYGLYCYWLEDFSISIGTRPFRI